MLAVRTSSSSQQQKFQTENKINSREVKEVKKENKKESKEVVQQKQHRKNSEKRFVYFKCIIFFCNCLNLVFDKKFLLFIFVLLVTKYFGFCTNLKRSLAFQVVKCMKMLCLIIKFYNNSKVITFDYLN